MPVHKGGGGVKKVQNLVHVVCERPLRSLFQEQSKNFFLILKTRGNSSYVECHCGVKEIIDDVKKKISNLVHIFILGSNIEKGQIN